MKHFLFDGTSARLAPALYNNRSGIITFLTFLKNCLLEFQSSFFSCVWLFWYSGTVAALGGVNINVVEWDQVFLWWGGEKKTNKKKKKKNVGRRRAASQECMISRVQALFDYYEDALGPHSLETWRNEAPVLTQRVFQKYPFTIDDYHFFLLCFFC